MLGTLFVDLVGLPNPNAQENKLSEFKTKDTRIMRENCYVALDMNRWICLE